MKLQPNDMEFTQKRRQQQLLACNTPSSKVYGRCFIMYSVLTGKKTISPSFKKNKVIFFSPVFTFLIYLKIVSHVANLPISHQGPLNCISTHVSIKVNVFIPKNIYHIHNYVQKSMTNCLFRDKYSFSS